MIKKLTIEVKVLLLGILFTRTALFMSTPFLAIYLSNRLHFSSLEIGYIIGIAPLINVLGSPLGGILSDQLNTRTILTYIPILWGLVFSGFFFAKPFLVFLLLNALNGLCYVIFEPTSKKMLSLLSTPDQRIFVYNFRYAAINIGAFLGPLLSLLLNTKYSLHSYLLLGILYIFCGILNGLVLKSAPSEKKNSAPSVAAKMKANKIRLLPYLLLLVGIAFSYFGYAQFNSTVPQFFANSKLFDSGVMLYSFLLSLNAAMILLLQLPVLKFTKSLSSYSVIILSNALFCISLWLLPQATHLFGLLCIVLAYSLGELLLGSRFDYLIDSLAPSKQKGLYFGLAELTKLGNSLGPVVGAYLIDWLSMDHYQTIFLILGMITLSGLPLIRLSSYFSK